MDNKKAYEQPEVLELGRAETLTLGKRGCAPDGVDCEYTPWEKAQAF